MEEGDADFLLCITEVQRTPSSLTTTLSIYCESSLFQDAGECLMATASRDSGNLGVFCNITYDYRKLDLMTTLNLPTLCQGSLCFSFSVVLPNRKLSKQEGWSDLALMNEYWLFSSTRKSI